MGILENILASVTRIEQHLGITGAVGVETTAAAVTPLTAPTTPTAPVTPGVPATTGELLDKFGVPWNEQFHAKTKTQNNDGSWKAAKGVDKDALAAYVAQFKSAAAPATTTTTPAAPGIPAAPGVPTPPATPATPAAPGVPTPPASLVALEQNGCMKNFKSLNGDYKVDYEVIVSTLIAKHGGNSFETAPVEAHATILAESNHWLEQLAIIEQAVETLDAINLKTGGVHQINTHTATVLSQASGTAVVKDIPFDKLDATAAAVKQYCDQWNEYCFQTTGAHC